MEQQGGLTMYRHRGGAALLQVTGARSLLNDQ
jgi:hypothetical protein